MTDSTNEGRAISVLEIERTGDTLYYRGNKHDLMVSGLVRADMLPANAAHARCGFRSDTGERWAVARMADDDVYELRIYGRDATERDQRTPTAPEPLAAHRRGGAEHATQASGIVREYTRLGVGALDLLASLLRKEPSAESVDAIRQTIRHLKDMYAGLERRHVKVESSAKQC